VLSAKSLSWDSRYLDILAGDQFTPEFRKINPKSLVPVLVDDGAIITESTVIGEYLEEAYPDPPIMPKDPLERVKVRLWTKIVDEILHPACAALTFVTSHRFTVMKLGPEKTQEFLNSTPAISVTPEWHETKRQFVMMGLDAPGAAEAFLTHDVYMKKMNEDLAGHEWLVGDRYGWADISLIPYVNRLAMLKLDGYWSNGRLPHLERWFKAVQARPDFKPVMLDWVPPSLTEDLATNGPKSWPRIAEIIGAK
jgi:glutathione S-transferase